jgi:hypothetical protein
MHFYSSMHAGGRQGCVAGRLSHDCARLKTDVAKHLALTTTETTVRRRMPVGRRVTHTCWSSRARK